MALHAWPTVTNRNVAQPSRVRLSTAPEAGPDVYDVTPIPGTVVNEGTLINQALFNSEKAYIDEHDIPLVTSTGNGASYAVTVPAWSGLTLAEMNGKVLAVNFNVASTTGSPALAVNGLASKTIMVLGGGSSTEGTTFPVNNYIVANRVCLLKFDVNANVFYIISAASRPYGGSFVYSPWAITGGGTGANTATGARANLVTPTYGLNEVISNTIHFKDAAGVDVRWLIAGDQTISATSNGILPAKADADNGFGYIGSSFVPWHTVFAKTFNGSIAASGITGVVPVASGGTGANSAPLAANSMRLKGLGYGYAAMPDGSDLNTFTIPGNYGCGSDTSAKTILNTPRGAAASSSTQAFNLTVESSLQVGVSLTCLRQTYKEWRYSNTGGANIWDAATYMRVTSDGGTTWGPWRVVSTPMYATTTAPGFVKVDGTTITINSSGVISAVGGGGSGYVLPPASATTLGGIKVGSGLSVTADGTLSAISGGVTLPVRIVDGGTGGTTATAARANLNVPTYSSDPTINWMHLLLSDGTVPQWLRSGLPGNDDGGLLPANSIAATGRGYIGTATWPWKNLYVKNINGTLNASNITGVLPIGNGGTGGGGILAAANSLHVMSLGPSSTTLASGTDLNTISTIGNYGCADSNIAKTILNTPYGATASTQVVAFRLTVESTVSNGTGNNIKQVFQEYYMTPENSSHPGKVYNRQSTNAGTGWSAWTMVQSNIQTVSSIWANTDYAKRWTVDTQALAYWNGAYTTTGTSHLSKLGTVSNGTWNANPIAIGYGGTGGNTVNAARANLGVLTFTPTNGGTRLLDVNGGDIAWITAGIATGASSNSGIVPAKSDSTNGWGSVGTMVSPFYIVSAKNLFGTLQTSNLSGIVTVAQGGTGGTTVASAKTGLGLGANVGTASVGSDTQFKEVYRIANSLYYVAGIANIKAASGSGVVTVGQLTFPFKLFAPVSGTTPLLLQVQSMVTPAGTYISLNQAADSTRVVTLSCYGGNATATTCSFAFLVHADV